MSNSNIPIQKHGFYLIDKPPGPTSRQAMMAALPEKRMKAGIEGILDPFASGLLVVATGPYTRFFDFFAGLEKEYLATLQLGSETDTLDSEGEITKEAPVHNYAEENIEQAMASFRGEISQIPPVYSNAKVQGKTARSRVRRGENIALAPRQVLIHRLTLEEVADKQIIFRCSVGRGTYIRSLARDLAIKLGTVGHLVQLRRTSIGHLRVAEAQAPDAATVRDEKQVLAHIRELGLSKEESQAIRHGRRFQSTAADDIYRLYDEDSFLGLGKVAGGQMRPWRLLPTQ